MIFRIRRGINRIRNCIVPMLLISLESEAEEQAITSTCGTSEYTRTKLDKYLSPNK